MPAKRKSTMRRRINRIARTRRAKSRKTGGNLVATAAVPFGLLALQRLLHSRKSNKSYAK